MTPPTETEAETLPKDPPEVVIDVPARPEEVVVARRAVAGFLRDHAWGGEDADALLLAVGEACNNAVNYGGTGLPEPRLSVTCRRLDGRTLQVEVRNRGNGFHPDANDLKSLGGMPALDEFATHGRGFGLMLALVDDVQVLSSGQDTTVRLTKSKGDV